MFLYISIHTGCVSQIKQGPARKPVLYAPQAASGVVGNPALCPAFRVRRGRAREIGFAASRARRATRPTPERFSVPCGHGADISSRQRAWGHAAARFAPRSPATPVRAGRAWEPARESGGDADRADCIGGRARGRDRKHADAREGLARRRSLAFLSTELAHFTPRPDCVRSGAVTGLSPRRRRRRARRRGTRLLTYCGPCRCSMTGQEMPHCRHCQGRTKNQKAAVRSRFAILNPPRWAIPATAPSAGRNRPAW